MFYVCSECILLYFLVDEIKGLERKNYFLFSQVFF